jgi:4'-phosphopantetheinyl transferase
MALHDEEKAKAFLAAWTRKEACLKATGEGIAGGLHRYRVSLHDEAKLVSIDGSTEASSKWTLHAFLAFGDGQAAICAAHPTLNVQGFTL